VSKHKAHPELVSADAARLALANAGGDRQAAYSRYIQLHYQATGRLAPECDNRDLQAWYDANLQETHGE